MTPAKAWAKAEAPLLGITEMMTRFRVDFGKEYAPNSRETVRRYSVHQFVQIGLVVANPDERGRPVNSPDNRYQIAPEFLALMKRHGSPSFRRFLRAYRSDSGSIRRLQSEERAMNLMPVTLPDGRKLKLTRGGQNELVKPVLEEFCPRFTPGGVALYVGDTGRKELLFEADSLRGLGVTLDRHGKIPDVVVHDPDRNWLILIEAVTSHGPIGLKRHNELKDLFKGSSAGLVFVTAFLTRRDMSKYLPEIAWETEVWVAEAPSHIIHFNGDRFLGPYG